MVNEPITSNPIAEPVPISPFAITFEEIVKIPDSGNTRKPSALLNFITHAGDSSGRLFVNDQRGKLYVIENQVASVYLDLKDIVGDQFFQDTSQQGFTYFTFHPEFKTNGIFYTVHTEEKGTKQPDFPVTKEIRNSSDEIIESSHHDVLLEWTVDDSSGNLFSGEYREVLRIEQPYKDHNLGQISFNPNATLGDEDYGLLYISASDGGSDGFPVSDTDPLDNGQDLSTPLGSILRIDPLGNNSVNGQYGIPEINPFVNDNDPQTLGEIYAYGLRNPQRFSWDEGGDGKLLIAEIGQYFIEEINLGKPGANYGWGEREGTWVVDEKNENVLFPLPEDDQVYKFTYPVAQYDHDVQSAAVTGGYVYRGQTIPYLFGEYVFADFSRDARFFQVGVDDLIEGQQAPIEELPLFQNEQPTTFLDIVNSNRSDVRFGVDETGELYVTSKQDGIVRKVLPYFENPQVDVIAEVGVAQVSQPNGNAWTTIELTHEYINPVVVVGPPSSNGGQPTTIRTRNITANSFEIQLDEWNYLDGFHVPESLPYLVIEAGTHTLTDGTTIKAGQQQINHQWESVDLGDDFTTTPVILSQVASRNGSSAVVTRHRNIDANGFSIRLQEEEAADDWHFDELVNYVAFETGQGNASGLAFEAGLTPNEVTHRNYRLNFSRDYYAPLVFGAMATQNGSDPSALRLRKQDSQGATLFIQEERSSDAEINHIEERIGYTVFDRPGLLYGLSEEINENQTMFPDVISDSTVLV